LRLKKRKKAYQIQKRLKYLPLNLLLFGTSEPKKSRQGRKSSYSLWSFSNPTSSQIRRQNWRPNRRQSKVHMVDWRAEDWGLDWKDQRMIERRGGVGAKNLRESEMKKNLRWDCKERSWGGKNLRGDCEGAKQNQARKERSEATRLRLGRRGAKVLYEKNIGEDQRIWDWG